MSADITTTIVECHPNGWCGIADTVDREEGFDTDNWGGLIHGPRRTSRQQAKRDAARAKQLLQAALDAAEIAAREQAATPGPWEVIPARYTTGWGICVAAGSWILSRFPGRSKVAQKKANAAFIATARTALPALLDEVERLTADNARLRDALAGGEVEASR